MSAKYIIQDLYDVAENRGGKCLSVTYINYSFKYRWQCAKKHEWNASWGSVKRGSWCRQCVRQDSKDSLEELFNYAVSMKGLCLSGQYFNTKTKYMWRCQQGHEWEATWAWINQGNWCPECAKTNTLYNIHDLCSFAEQKRGKCLSFKYITADTQYRWRCDQGHEWESTWSSVHKGTWCPECVLIQSRNELNDLHTYAHNHHGKCLADEYHNLTTKYGWECSKGHRWEATWSTMKKNSWCPECARLNSFEYTMEDLNNFALNLGGRCLSKKYTGVDFRYWWECSEGHRWKTPWASILRKSWCPECAKLQSPRYSLVDLQVFALENRGKCLSREYGNANDSYRWKCDQGHEWEAAWRYVRRGSWCPECRKNKSYSISDLQAFAVNKNGCCLSERYINTYSKYHWKCERGHEWKASWSGVLNGSWCSKCFHESSRYSISTLYDTAKNRRGVCLSTKYRKGKDKYHWKCEQGHEWKASWFEIKAGSWCPMCARERSRKHALSDLQIFAESKGGQCLSTEYFNSNRYYQWQCDRGHRWKMTWDRVKNGSWCPLCAKVSNRKYILEDLQKFAVACNGLCLSEEYINTKTKYLWQCQEGHRWESTWDIIKSDHWCPKCANARKRNSLRDLHQWATSKLGKCISDKYAGINAFYHWQCEQGHEWEASWNVIKRGRWCPTCAHERSKKHTLTDLQNHASFKGGSCLAVKYINNATIYRWRCHMGHEWDAKWNNVKRGSWCPYCWKKGNNRKK